MPDTDMVVLIYANYSVEGRNGEDELWLFGTCQVQKILRLYFAVHSVVYYISSQSCSFISNDATSCDLSFIR
jgi:hypothetical protein